MQTLNKKALILVDIQNDFLEGGSLAVPDSNSILQPVNKLIQKAKASNSIVIATKDWHPKDHISFASNHPGKQVFEATEIDCDGTKTMQVLWPVHCVQGSPGAEISKSIDENDIDFVVCKGVNSHTDSYSGFANNNYSDFTDLAMILYQNFVKQVVIVGLATDYCVKMTCIDAVKFGFETVLVKDCTRAVDQQQFDATLDYLKSKGVLVRPNFQGLFDEKQTDEQRLSITAPKKNLLHTSYQHGEKKLPALTA